MSPPPWNTKLICVVLINLQSQANNADHSQVLVWSMQRCVQAGGPDVNILANPGRNPIQCSVDVLRYGHAHEESVESVVSRITVFYC